MNKSVIMEMTPAELVRTEADLREELFRLRFQHHTGQLASPTRLRDTRRSLARVLTRQREIAMGIRAATAQES